MEKCSDIIVVISEKTKKSAWVYFEVGIAAHAQKATSTYMIDGTQLPEFLEYWSTLKNSNDLRAYISIKMEMYPSHKHLKNESYIGLKKPKYSIVFSRSFSIYGSKSTTEKTNNNLYK